MIIILILLIFIPCAYAADPSFEVASIRPAPMAEPGRVFYSGCNGGPGTNDPERWTCENMSLSDLVRSAFDLNPFQLKEPMSPGNELFNVITKVPEGTTRDQFQKMQQKLLIERFGLKYHREQKEMQGYQLVAAKNGPKFKESESELPKDPAADLHSAAIGKDGLPVIPPGVSAVVIGKDLGRGQWIRTTMEDFAAGLSLQAGKPVSDGTGLKGKYDISLQWTREPMRNVAASLPSDISGVMPPASEASGPNIFTALQEQLGLKLQPTKVTIEILAIDNIEKTPTEN